ncbi:hypothetical protein BLOT_008446 [Blomia tropicalis]|nr:hypothetical protein BLOT_008446 [Blomia tropicalis]
MASIIVEETTIVSVNTMNVDFNATNWSNSLMEQSWNTLTELKPSSTYLLELFVLIIGVIVLSLIMILIYRYRLSLNEDQKLSKAFHSTNRRFKRQSSRFSIDLDRFVADISGFDQNELNNAESNHIRFPIEETVASPTIAVIDTNLLAMNNSIKLDSVKEDDENVLFNQCVHCNNTEYCCCYETNCHQTESDQSTSPPDSPQIDSNMLTHSSK